jgi:hypothetical protein
MKAVIRATMAAMADIKNLIMMKKCMGVGWGGVGWWLRRED